MFKISFLGLTPQQNRTRNTFSNFKMLFRGDLFWMIIVTTFFFLCYCLPFLVLVLLIFYFFVFLGTKWSDHGEVITNEMGRVLMTVKKHLNPGPSNIWNIDETGMITVNTPMGWLEGRDITDWQNYTCWMRDPCYTSNSY